VACMDGAGWQRWRVFCCRGRGDTRTRFRLELARSVARVPRVPHPPPLLEIGTRSGGSALLMLRVLNDIYPRGSRQPLVLTVGPYGTRPYEGSPSLYDERHYRAMKRNLALFANHIHYMMDSTLFLQTLQAGLYLWIDGAKKLLDEFTLVYL